jgi:hypothetical protein
VLSTEAAEIAARIAARFPSARIGKPTLQEWTAELVKLTPDRGELVLAWISENLDTAPTFKQIRLAMARVRPTVNTGSPEHMTDGLGSACEFCGQPRRKVVIDGREVEVEAPVPNGPDAASRYDAEFDRWFNCHLSCLEAQRELVPR